MLTGQVFVSHTSDMASFPADRSYVQAAVAAVERAKLAPVDMQYFAAREGAPAEYCQRRVAECEIYVAVVGFRYGSMVPSASVSYTELEFLEAGAAGLPRLVFLLEETADLPANMVDADLSLVDGFRCRLRDADLLVRTFTSDTGLELEVFQALTELTWGGRRGPDQEVLAACPYPGLLGYEVSDAKYFFGRDALIAEVIAKMAASALVMVVGPSGSGKSSLLNAGLRPKLEAGHRHLPGSRDWPVVAMTPGREPLRELAARTSTAAGVAARGLWRDLLADPRSFDEMARQAALRGRADAAPGRMILIVDQFEEIFAETVSDAERVAFIEAVCGAANADAPAVSVVLGLRADFYRNCLHHESLRTHLQRDQVIVGPLSDSELREVISRPAERGGWRLQDGLTDLIMTDVTGTGEVLPLLNTALEQTWRRRRGRILTVEGYRDTGGVTGALAKLADELYAELADAERDALRVLLIGLVGFHDDGKVTAARVTSDELLDRLPATGPYQRVLDKLVRRRLVTVGDGTVRVVHEALLWHWPHMSDWIMTNRAWLRAVERVQEGARQRAAGRGHLYQGGELDAAIAETDLARRRADLPPEAAAFLDAGLAARRRSTRRRRRGIAALAVTTVLAVIAAAFAVAQWRSAIQQRRLATCQALLAQVDELRTSQVGQSLLLGIAAMKACPAEQARAALITALIGSHAPTTLPGDGTAPQAVAFSHSGHLLFTAYSPLGYLWDVADRAHPRRVATLRAGGAWSAAFSRGDRLLATCNTNGALLWDMADLARPPIELPRPADGTWVTSVAFSPDGRRLLAGEWDNNGRGLDKALLWDVSVPTEPHLISRLRIRRSGPVRAVAFSPDGRIAYTANYNGTVGIWNVTHPPATPAPIGVLHAHRNAVYSIAVSPNGRTLLTGSADQTAALWSLTNPARPTHLATLSGQHSGVRAVAFSPDGTTVATASLDNTAILWRITNRTVPVRLDTLTGDSQPLWGLAFSPDGKTIVTSSSDGSVIVWDVTDHAQPVQLSSLTGDTSGAPVLAYSPDGRTLADGTWDGRVILWGVTDPRAPRPLKTFTAQTGTIFTLAFRPDGRILATGSWDGTVVLWDVASPTAPAALTTIQIGSPVDAVGFTRDGRTLAVGDTAGRTTLWDVADPRHPRLLGHPIADQPYPIRMVAFTPDGRTLVIGNSGGLGDAVQAWDVTDPLHPRELSHFTDLYGVYSGGFGPDGHTLALAEEGAKTTLWNLANPAAPQRIVTLHGQASSVYTSNFSRDGLLLASGGFDRTVIIWDVSDHRAPAELVDLANFPESVGSAVFSPDGRTLAISGGNTPTLWDISYLHKIVANPAQAACAITGRGLSPDQWRAAGTGFPYQPTC